MPFANGFACSAFAWLESGIIRDLTLTLSRGQIAGEGMIVSEPSPIVCGYPNPHRSFVAS